MMCDEGIGAVFVYGTLKRGEINSPLLAAWAGGAVAGWTRGQLYDVGLYPALVAGDGRVWGEVVRVPERALADVLALLDELEDYRPADLAGSMYVREIVDVVTDGGGCGRAYAYFYNRDHSALAAVPSGVWTGAPPTHTAAETEYARHVRTFHERAGQG